MSLTSLRFSNRLLKVLPADPVEGPELRQVSAAYSLVKPTPVVAPQCIAFSEDMLDRLGISRQEAQSQAFAEVFAGNQLLDGMQPHATCYGGHQFGNWAGQLGDGRAINLGEVETGKQGYLTLQLKGAGPTPYSRSADGRAVLRSSIREFLCSEAMFHLGIPTTRALSLCLTGEQVERDMFYDGHPCMEPGAVVCRVSPSFTRFGHFQLPAFRRDHELLRQWVTTCIQLDYPHLLNGSDSPDRDTILQWFAEVCDRTCTMIVHWMRVGFVHGVMNTDNMSIIGETIDYGPYGWLDDFDPHWTPNTTDAHGRRYRYGAQPEISHWNLYQLANAIFPLVEAAEPLREILDNYEPQYRQRWQAMMAAKLGLGQDMAHRQEV
ncbi:MAG: YdiU family protein, partial [Gammaproteobacteria bacterium]